LSGARACAGGGYSYRICPRASALSEDCFQKLPLEFVNGSQTLRWDGANGTTKNIGGQYVVTGTHPAGSSWAKVSLQHYNILRIFSTRVALLCSVLYGAA
jgi:hypothetical protein